MATEDKRIDQLPVVGTLSPEDLLVIQQSGEGMKMTAQQLLDYLNSASGSVVLYVTQELTEDQRAQARKNIRCGSVGVVGENCTANAYGTHAEGDGTAAMAYYSHAEGYGTAARAYYSHAEGNKTIAGSEDNISHGEAAHAEGWETKAIGQASHAEGCNTNAEEGYSHAEGYGTKAQGKYSHAEGSNTEAQGESSHAEGYGARAPGSYSHAEGSNTEASGVCSHAEGYATTASGHYSHAEGNYTNAQGKASHVEGEYNIPDPEADDYTQRGKYVHIVGNGTADDARSNAHTLDWDGNAWYAGSMEGTAMILKSPGGKRFSVTVNDSGALTAEEIV